VPDAAPKSSLLDAEIAAMKMRSVSMAEAVDSSREQDFPYFGQKLA
jgi:hypothetical protein